MSVLQHSDHDAAFQAPSFITHRGHSPSVVSRCSFHVEVVNRFAATFLVELGVSDVEALVEHNLAPLAMIRDIARLGILFKVSHGTAPRPILDFFRPGSATMTGHNFRPVRPLHDRFLQGPLEPGHPITTKRSMF